MEEWICQVPEDIAAAVRAVPEADPEVGLVVPEGDPEAVSAVPAVWVTDLLPLPDTTGVWAAEWDIPRAAAAAAAACFPS